MNDSTRTPDTSDALAGSGPACGYCCGCEDCDCSDCNCCTCSGCRCPT